MWEVIVNLTVKILKGNREIVSTGKWDNIFLLIRLRIIKIRFENCSFREKTIEQVTT